jgi:hypothetical protein
MLWNKLGFVGRGINLKTAFYWMLQKFQKASLSFSNNSTMSCLCWPIMNKDFKETGGEIILFWNARGE